MGDKIIKCHFNLFQEGRKYTGHHRSYILESAVKTCYAPETREKIQLREALGYLGHGRRVIARKMQLEEVEPVRLPDGSTIIVENVPSNVTVFFEVNKNGDVEHHQEILETAPGNVVAGLNASKVGGFSWACGGADGGALGATKITNFHGFDYVTNPGFSANRGYILENADGQTRDLILESICKLGVDDKTAEEYLKSWVASAQLRAMDLEDRLEDAAIYEDALREAVEAKDNEVAALKKQLSDIAEAGEKRKKTILECAEKSVVVVPDRVLQSLISMASEADFGEIINFYESASRLVSRNNLPVPGSTTGGPAVAQRPKLSEVEYGTAEAGYDFSESQFL